MQIRRCNMQSIWRTAAIGRLVWVFIALAIVSFACATDPDDVEQEWERSLNLFEHRCEAVLEAGQELKSDDEALHALRSGVGTDHDRQVREDVEDCLDRYEDLLSFLEDNEESLVAQWRSDQYTSTLETAQLLGDELRDFVQGLGPYATATERNAQEDRIGAVRAQRQEREQQERAQQRAREERAEERAACPHHLRYHPRPNLTNARAWAVGTLQEDGSLRIWVSAANQATPFDACLRIDDTVKLVRQPDTDVWYRSGAVRVDTAGGELAARGRLNADGSLQLELVSNHNFVAEPTIGRVPEPRTSVIYTATQAGQRLLPCDNHARYGGITDNGRAWSVARLRDDGSMEIWIALGRSKGYHRCLKLNETVRIAANPLPDRWYSSAAYQLPNSDLEAQAMLADNGELHLRILRSGRDASVCANRDHFRTQDRRLVHEPTGRDVDPGSLAVQPTTSAAKADQRTTASLFSLEPLFRNDRAAHRFPASMGKRVQVACAMVRDEYDNAAAKIWKGKADAKTVMKRLSAIPGIGKTKQGLAVMLLGRYYGIELEGWHEAAPIDLPS